MVAPKETIRADTYPERVRPQGRAAAQQITRAALRDPVGTIRKSDRPYSGSRASRGDWLSIVQKPGSMAR